MSELAGQFYINVARSNAVGLPHVLSGAVLSVGEEDINIPAHMVDSDSVQDRVKPIVSELVHLIGDASAFVYKVALARHPEADRQHSQVAGSYESANRMLLQLRPKKVAAGRLDNFGIEALAPEEVDDPRYVFKARQLVGEVIETEGVAAYLVLSADLHAGRPLGRVGVLAKLIMHGWHDSSQGAVVKTLMTPPKLQTTGLKINDQLAKSGNWQSIATARVVEGVRRDRTIMSGLPSTGRQGGGSGRN